MYYKFRNILNLLFFRESFSTSCKFVDDHILLKGLKRDQTINPNTIPMFGSSSNYNKLTSKEGIVQNEKETADRRITEEEEGKKRDR